MIDPRVVKVEYFDTRLSIRAMVNTKSLSGVDPQRIALHQATIGPLGRRVMERSTAEEYICV